MMFTALFSAVLFATLARTQQSDPYINTPQSVTQCEPSSLTFGGSHSPWDISIFPGGQPGSTIYEDLGSFSSSPYTWICDQLAGRYIQFQIRDATGALGYSAAFTVLSSSNSSCLNGGGGGGGGTTTTSGTESLNTGTTTTTTSTGGSTTHTGTTLPAGGTSTSSSLSSKSTPSSGTGTTSKPPSTTTSPSSTSPTASKGAASHLEAHIGVAGFLGLIGAALMM